MPLARTPAARRGARIRRRQATPRAAWLRRARVPRRGPASALTLPRLLAVLWYDRPVSDEAKSQVALTRSERRTLALARFINERPLAKKLQHAWLTRFNQSWVRYAIGRRVFADNIEWLVRSPREGGVALCLNHRSYFDAYITLFAVF